MSDITHYKFEGNAFCHNASMLSYSSTDESQVTCKMCLKKMKGKVVENRAESFCSKDKDVKAYQTRPDQE